MWGRLSLSNLLQRWIQHLHRSVGHLITRRPSKREEGKGGEDGVMRGEWIEEEQEEEEEEEEEEGGGGGESDRVNQYSSLSEEKFRREKKQTRRRWKKDVTDIDLEHHTQRLCTLYAHTLLLYRSIEKENLTADLVQMILQSHLFLCKRYEWGRGADRIFGAEIYEYWKRRWREGEETLLYYPLMPPLSSSSTALPRNTNRRAFENCQKCRGKGGTFTQSW